MLGSRATIEQRRHFIFLYMASEAVEEGEGRECRIGGDRESLREREGVPKWENCDEQVNAGHA